MSSVNSSMPAQLSPSLSWRYYIHQFWTYYGDARTTNLPFIREGPLPMIILMFVYIMFVTKLGPQLMSKRKPFELRTPMLIYNTLMVLLNGYFFFESLRWIGYGRELGNFKWPDGRDTSAKTMANIWSFYLYTLTKFVDLFDTVFFVLRKKYNQITYLHLYHHTSVPILGWFYLWYRFGSPAVTLFTLLNCLVHVTMYSYYALSAFGPKMQKFLWWKQYITQIQILQFGILSVYGVFVYLYQHGYPPLAQWLASAQPPLYFIMFSQFYFQSYRAKQIKKENDCKIN